MALRHDLRKYGCIFCGRAYNEVTHATNHIDKIKYVICASAQIGCKASKLKTRRQIIDRVYYIKKNKTKGLFYIS